MTRANIVAVASPTPMRGTANADAPAEGPCVLIRRQQDRYQVAEQGCGALMPGKRSHQVVRPPERSEPGDQFARHLFGHVRRAGGELRKSHRDGEQVLDPVSHLAGEKLMAFLGLLAAGHVEEDAVGQTHVDGRIVADARGEIQRISAPTMIRKSIS